MINKNNWINAVTTNCLEFGLEYPQMLNQVSKMTIDDLNGKENSKLYYKVAKCIVEPENLFGDEQDFYYDRTESQGFQFVKSGIGDIDNKEMWSKVIDLIDENGY